MEKIRGLKILDFLRKTLRAGIPHKKWPPPKNNWKDLLWWILVDILWMLVPVNGCSRWQKWVKRWFSRGLLFTRMVDMRYMFMKPKGYDTPVFQTCVSPQKWPCFDVLPIIVLHCVLMNDVGLITSSLKKAIFLSSQKQAKILRIIEEGTCGD